VQKLLRDFVASLCACAETEQPSQCRTSTTYTHSYRYETFGVDAERLEVYMSVRIGPKFTLRGEVC